MRQIFALKLILGAFYELHGILWTFKGIFRCSPSEFPTLTLANTHAEFSILDSSFVICLTTLSCSNKSDSALIRVGVVWLKHSLFDADNSSVFKLMLLNNYPPWWTDSIETATDCIQIVYQPISHYARTLSRGVLGETINQFLSLLGTEIQFARLTIHWVL